ncbi:hypothetical protein BSM4216_2767 [Bacillus smithii]|nr:hypothetical protein BSM4216_2767 [Bacillus smithii]
MFQIKIIMGWPKSPLLKTRKPDEMISFLSGLFMCARHVHEL